MRFLTMLCVAVACVLIAGGTHVPDATIIIRHDRPDSAYRALGTRYADVLAHVEDRVEGVLLASRWVLTAAHAVETIGPFDRRLVAASSDRRIELSIRRNGAPLRVRMRPLLVCVPPG